MCNIFTNYEELFDTMIKINGENPLWLYNKKNNSLPVSNKYFLTMLYDKNIDVLSFLNHIDDSERKLEYPFVKKDNIDYSFMIENVQIYNIDLKNSSLLTVSNNLDEFLSVTKESEAEIILVLDINYLIDFFVITKKKSQPNHLFDLIIWKLKNKLSHILILDNSNIIINPNNMLCTQLEKCLKNNSNNSNFDKKMLVFKDTSESVIENVYWNLFYPEMKISEYIEKIKSPYDDSYFDIVQINDKICYLYEVCFKDIIIKNIMNLKSQPGILIEPLDRLNIFV